MSQDNERCWICLVDKIDDPTSEWSQPCKCSLIAHKECLLVWVQSKLSEDNESAVCCPQCGEKYSIVTKSPMLLPYMRSIEKVIQRVSPLITFAGIGVGVGGISALYGSAVTRAVLGPLASAPMLNKSTWSWSKWSTLSIVPWALMFYNSEFPDKFPATYFFVIPYSYFFPLNPMQFTWPPSPILTLASIPPIRAFYGSLRTRINNYFFSRSTYRSPNPRRETFTIGGAEFQLQYGTVDEDERDRAIDQQQQNNENGVEDEEVQFRYRLTLSSICRYLTSTLAWPFASRLFSDILLNFKFFHPLFAYKMPITFTRSLIPLCLRHTSPSEFANDPVWVRTAIAAFILTFFADATKLVYKKLESVERRTRYVENKK